MKMPELIKDLRVRQGKTQFELATLARVSLPTIQKIEAGQANPGLKIVEEILRSLNYEISFTPREPDWDQLATYGVPLTTKRRRRPAWTKKEMIDELKAALIYHSVVQPETTREWEAIGGFLLGLKTHYQNAWDSLGPLRTEAEALIENQDHGRLLKLRRLAIAAQAKYL